MAKFALILLASVVGALPQACNKKRDQTGLDLGPVENWPVVRYDGPRFEMTPEMWQDRLTNASWERPAEMPIIELQAGTILDMGYGDDDNNNNNTLGKRSGVHWAAAYDEFGCPDGTGHSMIVVHSFGCGNHCIVLPREGLSGRIRQQIHANPYPTMDVWENTLCQGTRDQHFGVETTNSCTDSLFCGFRSFVVYYDC